jgi:spore coat polysaccharide biosynthesis predicted glycosyltransferase SpsG
VLRADASSSTGLGHVVRSLTLGRELVTRGWRVSLATAHHVAAIEANAEASGISLIDVPDDVGGKADAVAVLDRGADVVVVDGYHFGDRFFAALRTRHVVIDDDGTTPAQDPAIVVNQNPHAERHLYERLRSTTLLLGLRFALVRPEITLTEAPTTRSGAFVSLGGSDPLGLTADVAAAVVAHGLPARVVIGPVVADAPAVVDRLAGIDHVTIVEPAEFASALAASAVAVIGAGTTMWEAAHLGVPAVALVVADNQAAPATAATAAGFVESLDCRVRPAGDAVARAAVAIAESPARQAAMARRGREAVDGRGACRVADAIEELVSW